MQAAIKLPLSSLINTPLKYFALWLQNYFAQTKTAIKAGFA